VLVYSSPSRGVKFSFKRGYDRIQVADPAIAEYLVTSAGRLCDLGCVEIQWFAWGERLFRDFEDRAAAGREARLRRLDELAAKELDMLIDGSDGSVSGKAGDDEADVAEMMSARTGESEPESASSDEDEESDDAEDELVGEDSAKPKAKGKGRVKPAGTQRKSHTTGHPINLVRQGKANSYQTIESVQVSRILSARFFLKLLLTRVRSSLAKRVTRLASIAISNQPKFVASSASLRTSNAATPAKSSPLRSRLRPVRSAASRPSRLSPICRRRSPARRGREPTSARPGQLLLLQLLLARPVLVAVSSLFLVGSI